VIESVCDRHQTDNSQNPSLEDIIAVDQWARQEVLAAQTKLNQTVTV
jgi:1-deoxy-D-xylulose-5-phosphate reductoisomerase